MLRRALVVVALCGLAGPALAASAAVELACAADYVAYCNAFDSDSPEGRQCMDTNGNKLSWLCIKALIAAGEVTQEEVDRRAALANKPKGE